MFLIFVIRPNHSLAQSLKSKRLCSTVSWKSATMRQIRWNLKLLIFRRNRNTAYPALKEQVYKLNIGYSMKLKVKGVEHFYLHNYIETRGHTSMPGARCFPYSWEAMSLHRERTFTVLINCAPYGLGLLYWVRVWMEKQHYFTNCRDGRKDTGPLLLAGELNHTTLTLYPINKFIIWGHCILIQRYAY